MKQRSVPFRHPVSAAPLLAMLFAMSTPLQAAGTFTWDGQTNGTWPTATNWSTDIAPSSDNETDLVFDVPTSIMYLGNPRISRSLTFGSGITSNIGVSFNFNNNTSGINLRMWALSGNASINVDAAATGNITLGIAPGATGNGVGALVLTSNLDVVHNGTGQLTFNRIVSGDGALTKTGSGTVAFTGGTNANTYTGLTTVSAGGLNLSKSAGTDAIAGDLLVNGTGTVTLTAANQIKDTSNVEVAAGTFALATLAETVNGVKLTGGAITGTTGVLTSTTAYDFQSGSASAILAGTAGATKTTAGTVTLSRANTYTGVTTISAGTLSVGSIGNGGVAGNLGQATNAATNLVFDGGTLQYTGANATSDRAFTINAGKTATIDTANNISFAGATGTTTDGALTKLGAGTLTLTGTNTYTGDTTISAGTLSVATNLIGSSTNIFIGNGATLASSSGFSMTAGQSITGTGATGTINGNANPGLTMNGSNTVSNNAGGQLSLIRLSVYGSNNTITAGDIQSGVSGTSRGLNIGNGNAGSLTITGGSLTTNGNSTTGDILGSTSASGVGTLTINGGSYTANSAQGLFIGFGAGSGTLTLTSGSVTLPALTLGAVNNFSDAIVNLDGGTFTLGGLTVTSGRSNQINFNGGTLVASATLPLGNGAGNVTFNVKDGGAIIDTNSNTVTISNPLVDFGGNSTGGLTKQNTGTLVLSGTNTYTGNTTISAGTLQIGNGGTTGSIAPGGDIANNAILALNRSDALTISNIISGSGVVNQIGNGTTTLTSSSTYTGVTTVSAGTLLMGDAASDTFATSEVTVASSARLGGSGTIIGSVGVTGILAPGVAGVSDGIGTLNAGTTTWNGAAGSAPETIWQFDLGASTSDRLNITGDFIKNTTAGTTFKFDFMGSTPTWGTTYTLVDWSTGTTAFTGTDFSFTGLSGFWDPSTFNVDTTNRLLTFTAVPEPTTALAGLLLTAGLLRRRR